MKQTQRKLQRQKSWKRYSYLFNECKNLNFQCQCGKSYTSFPGLYLHFQRKHGQKISTKFTLNDCQVINQFDKTTYRYKFEVKRLIQDDQNGTKDPENGQSINLSLDSVLRKFTQQSYKQLLENPLFKTEPDIGTFLCQVVSNFQIFILRKAKEQQNSKRLKVILRQIPQKLNDFMEQSQFCNRLTYEKGCEILLVLSVWLRKEGYTDLVIQRNIK